MSCYSCGGNPSTFCRECNYPKDTWIAPVDKLPDTFMGDFDHLFRTPDGNLYALAPERDRWIRVNGEAGNAVSYNDTELKKRVTALEGRTDNFVSGIGVSREGDKVKLKYTFIDGTHKEVEFEDKDTKSIAYDDSALKARVSALETKTDKDTVYDDSTLKARVKALEDKPAPAKQKLSLSGNTLSLTDGGSVTLPDNSQPVHRFYDGDIPGRADTNTVKTVPKTGFRNPDGLKVGDTVEDYWSDRNTINRGIWKVTEISGNNVKVQGIGNYDANIRRNLSFNANTRTLSIDEGGSVTLPNDKQTISKNGNKIVLSNGGGEVDIPTPKDSVPYDDTALRNRVKALEDKPAPAKQKLSLSGNTLSLTDGGSVTLPDNSQPVHRFYDGDIPGRADTNTVKTVPKTGFRNPDGLKVGDTVEDYWSDRNTINRGIWKVTEISGNNVKVQGIGNYDANIRRNLSFNANTRTLSIDEGGSVTLPNDKQTISKNGNKIVLSNGGGEVDIPTATPYNDADIKRRLGVLEAKPDNDKQTLSISGNTLSISNGNSVNIPQPNLSGYVPVAEYNKVKGALEKLLTDLKGSGAWRQTGSTVFEGELYPNRHVATGNINLFGGATDGSSFIRTNNGSTENDLAGGIG